MNDLFRPEAVEHRHRRLLGEVSLAVPLSTWSLSLVTVLLFAVVLGIVLFTTVSTKAAAPGILKSTGSVVQIRSPERWLIEQSFVEEGQSVSAGQPLFTATALSGADADPRTQQGISSSIQAQLDSLGRQRTDLNQMIGRDEATTATRLASDKLKLRSLDDQIALQSRRIAVASNSLKQVQAAIQTGFVSKLELSRREDDLLAAQQAASELAAERASLVSDMSDRAEQSSERRNRNAVAMEGINQNQTAVAARKLAVESQRRFVVRAPASGKIDLLLISPGRTTSAGEVQISIAPVNSQLIAEAYFPSRSIGFVRVGQDARLAFDAFPPAKYGYAFGKVVAVANTPLDPADVPAAVRSDDPTYRVQVRLTQPFPRSSQSPLRPGMQLQAYLMLDNRRLWEALIRPILDTGR